MRVEGYIDPRALGLNVTKLSGDEAICLCPFHSDHSPSASFNMVTGLFHCFACGEDANIHKLMSYLGGEFLVVEKIAVTSGIHHTESEDEWNWVLRCEPAIGNEYLHSRRVTDDEVMKYNIRQFKEGVAFISTDMKGKAIGAQLRLYKGERRYLILGEKPKLWPIVELPKSHQGTIVFVEGPFGALNARRAGVNAYAVMGVASAVNSVSCANGFRRKVLVFDDDAAGHIAAMKILSLNEGFMAFCPGAEADEMTEAWWKVGEGVKYEGCISNHLDFGRCAGASVESLQAVQKFIRRRSIRPREKWWKR